VPSVARYELVFDLSCEGDAAIYEALRRLIQQRRAAHVVRQALERELLGGQPSRSAALAIPAAPRAKRIVESSAAAAVLPETDADAAALDAFMDAF
jgi:hypothetical protein